MPAATAPASPRLNSNVRLFGTTGHGGVVALISHWKPMGSLVLNSVNDPCPRTRCMGPTSRALCANHPIPEETQQYRLAPEVKGFGSDHKTPRSYASNSLRPKAGWPARHPRSALLEGPNRPLIAKALHSARTQPNLSLEPTYLGLVACGNRASESAAQLTR